MARSNSTSLSKSVSEKLFQQAKWKKAISNTNIKIQQKINKHMADCKKTSFNSQMILLNKHFKTIDQFLSIEPYNQGIDIAKSIKLFSQLGVFGKLKSVDQLIGLDTCEICDRMETEIKFIYLLWESIPFQQLPHQSFKNIMKWLFSLRYKSPKVQTPSLLKKSSLKEMQSAWNKLSTDLRLYQQKLGIKHTNKQNIISSSRSPQRQVKNSRSIKKIYTGWMSKSIQQQNNNLLDEKDYYKVRQICNNDLIARLYDPRCYEGRQNMRIQKQQQKIHQELQKCTFKPIINKVVVPQSSYNSVQRKVKGYFKTIDRLRQANQKYLQNKKLKQHIPRGQNYDKLRKKGFNPPKFLNRKKIDQNPVILNLELEICKKKIYISVKERDNIQKVANHTCRIYSFNNQIQREIISIIEDQMSKYQRLKTIQ